MTEKRMTDLFEGAYEYHQEMSHFVDPQIQSNFVHHQVKGLSKLIKNP